MTPMSLWTWAFPPAPVRIDLAGPADTPALAQIHAASFAHEWSVDELSALMGDRQVITLVARRANALGTRSPIGFLLLRIAADEAEVLTVAVDPRRRSRGCGRNLMLEGFVRLVRRGVTRVFLEVDEGNASAVKLYRRLGFTDVGVRKGYYRQGNATSNALVMRLDLA
jgi:ribosomal-protein-alanine N-acetyltransferase